jgi:AcrR family transcriptional regulator
MIDPVKPKRKYASTRRAGQAADTRALVIAAARTAFIEAGWAGTTIAGVARAAGVSSETIYAVFGTKQALLLAAVERAVRRAEPDVALLDQAGPKAVVAAPSQREQLALFARDITDVLGNVAELMAVVRSAAASDATLEALYQNLHAGRRRNLGFVARALAQSGPLRAGFDAEAATAMLWRLASPDLFLLLTKTEGLSTQDYAAWLAATLEATLLPDQPAAS